MKKTQNKHNDFYPYSNSYEHKYHFISLSEQVKLTPHHLIQVIEMLDHLQLPCKTALAYELHYRIGEELRSIQKFDKLPSFQDHLSLITKLYDDAIQQGTKYVFIQSTSTYQMASLPAFLIQRYRTWFRLFEVNDVLVTIMQMKLFPKFQAKSETKEYKPCSITTDQYQLLLQSLTKISTFDKVYIFQYIEDELKSNIDCLILADFSMWDSRQLYGWIRFATRMEKFTKSGQWQLKRETIHRLQQKRKKINIQLLNFWNKEETAKVVYPYPLYNEQIGCFRPLFLNSMLGQAGQNRFFCGFTSWCWPKEEKGEFYLFSQKESSNMIDALEKILAPSQ